MRHFPKLAASLVPAALAALVLAGCAGDPPMPAASPAPAPAPAPAPTPAPPPPADPPPPAPVAATPPPADTSGDIMACIQRATGVHSNDACRACAIANCVPPMRALGASCADFKTCICSGDKTMMDCAPFMMNQACMHDGQLVSACMHQNCAAQCPRPQAQTQPAQGQGGFGQPAASPDADPCAALNACCAQMGAGAPPSCAKIVGTGMPQACSPMLQMYRGQQKCH